MRLTRNFWAGLAVAASMAVSASAKVHVMSRGGKEGGVPNWENIFDEGPFDLPQGLAREASAEEACARGFAALHQLDDREAERAFRLAIVNDESMTLAYLGLALANDAAPGRALAFATRAVQKRATGQPADQRMAESFAIVCATSGGDRPLRIREWTALLGELAGAETDAVRKANLMALQVRWLLSNNVRLEAETVLRELLALAPGHPAQAYRLWVADGEESVAEALAHCPATPGARRAAGELLQKLGRYEEAAGWFLAAAALAAERHPADMEDWRLVEEARLAATGMMAAAGKADFPEDAPLSVKLEGWLRLEQWDRIKALPDLPAKASLTDQAALAASRALAAFAQGKAEAAWPRLAELQQLQAKARHPATALPAAGQKALFLWFEEAMVANLLARGEKAEALSRLRVLRETPPLRASRLALAAGDRAEALRLAQEAVRQFPRSVPENALLEKAKKAAGAVESGTAEPPLARDPRFAPPIPPGPVAGALPAWTLAEASGAAHTATASASQPTVYLFFLGHECRHCMNQLRTFAPRHAQFEKAGIRLIAVSTDGPEGVAQTFASTEAEAAQRPFPFAILADPAQQAFQAWGVIDQFYGDPIHGVFILDAAGRLRWRHLGVEPYMDVDEVLSAAAELAP